jgi:PAS domain S-box-containing protein
MQVKQRLKINMIITVVTAFAILLVLVTAVYRISLVNEESNIADEILSNAFERSTFREDFLQTDNERAKAQWFAKHEQNGKLVNAAKKFGDAADKRIIDEMVKDHEATLKLFTAIVENREKARSGLVSAELSREIESRLGTQLKMRLYDKVINVRALSEAADRRLLSTIKLAGLSIFLVIAGAISVAIINALTMSRTIADRVGTLRDGVSVIGSGNLDHRIDSKGDDEFAELGRAFNVMTAKLSGSYRNLEKEIEERKQAEAALRESEERFRLMGDTIPYGAWMADAEGRNIYISPLFLELVGMTFEQVKEFGWTGKMPPEDVEPTMRRWTECVRTGCDWEGELRFPSPDGRWHTILSRGRPVRDAQGQIKAWVGINLDITERKQTEEALRKAHDELELRVEERTKKLVAANDSVKAERQRLYDVLETLPVYVVLLDRDYRVPFANRFFRERFGESGGKRCYEYLFNRTEPCDICETYTVLKTNAPHHWYWTGPDGRDYDIYDFPFVDADGATLILEMGIDITAQKQAQKALREMNETLEQRITERTAELQAANVLLLDSRRAALNMMEDALAARGQVEESNAELLQEVTERKKAEADVLKLSEDMAVRNVELEAVNKELESFIYSVSHDLRAPIRTMAGFSKIIEEDYADKLDAQGKDYLCRIQGGSEKATMLIDDLLRLSRITRQEMDRLDVDMSAKAASIVAELRESNSGRNVDVKVQPGLKASADPRLIEVVLSNIVGNAWKFTSKTPDARIEFGMIERETRNTQPGTGSEIVYFIRDNGAGFDQAYAEKMFWPFQRLHSDREFEGTGIGLAIVERVIRRHGGKVWAEGVPNKGATVYFTLG